MEAGIGAVQKSRVYSLQPAGCSALGWLMELTTLGEEDSSGFLLILQTAAAGSWVIAIAGAGVAWWDGTATSLTPGRGGLAAWLA